MKCITVSVLGFAIFSILLAYVALGDKEPGGKPVIKVAYVVSFYLRSHMLLIHMINLEGGSNNLFF